MQRLYPHCGGSLCYVNPLPAPYGNDPAQKADADLGVQLSYIAQQVNVTTGWWGGWWDYGFWGPWWGGWYYPYTVSYSYATNRTETLTGDIDGQGNVGFRLGILF